MRVRTPTRALLASAPLLLTTAMAASPASIRYSWSGFVEPHGPENPWNLAGDGSAVTNTDGTPFRVVAIVDEAALDQDGTQNPDFAEFVPEATLLVGGRAAVLDSPRMIFGDDEFEGLFDSVGLQANAELLGTVLFFAADVRLPPDSFDLAAPAAPDPPPSFAESNPTQLGGFGLIDLTTIPEDAPVTAVVVPWGAFPAATIVEWDTGTTGHAGDVDVTVSGIADSTPFFLDLSTFDFAAAPSFLPSSGLDYATGSTWTVTFSEPVATLLVYGKFWRGPNGGGPPDPFTYHFDVPFSIRSGFGNSSVVGNAGGLILSVPSSEFQDGVVQVPGPLTSLTVTPNSDTSSQQAMAMAVVPLPQAQPVDWSTATTGSAGGITVTMADLGASDSLQSEDLSGSDFAVAPLASTQEVLEYDTGADWTLTLSEPAPGLLLYARAWRGMDAGIDPVTVRFDAPFTILSGLAAAKVSENGQALGLPGDGFHDGILFFPGPIQQLSAQGDAPADVAQAMTVALVAPEPGACGAGLASGAALLGLRRVRPRRTARAGAAAARRS